MSLIYVLVDVMSALMLVLVCLSLVVAIGGLVVLLFQLLRPKRTPRQIWIDRQGAKRLRQQVRQYIAEREKV